MLRRDTSGILLQEKRSFFALCDVLDGWQTLNFGGVVHGWEQAVQTYYELHQAAYPDHVPQFKYHCMMHLPHWEFLFSCLVTERKHKTGKAYGAFIQNKRCFEKSVLEDLLLQQIRSLSALRLGTFLDKAKPARGALADMLRPANVRISRAATNVGIHASIGDFIWVRVAGDDRLAVLKAHLQVNPSPALPFRSQAVCRS